MIDINELRRLALDGDLYAVQEIIARLEAAEKERDELRAKINAMERQESVAKVRVHQTGGNAGVAWSAQPLNDFDSIPPLRDGDKLYALPGAQAQPAPSVPWVSLAERMPNPDEHDRVLIYTEGYDFGGEQVFDVKAEALNECRYIDPDEQPETCKAASHWMPHPRNPMFDYAAHCAQPAPKAVAYLDLGVGGYMDIGTDLTDEELATLPKGRHMLGVIGTYGVDGYVPAQPAPSVPGVDALAQFIREIDGDNRLGAGALAERIVEWLAAAPEAKP